MGSSDVCRGACFVAFHHAEVCALSTTQAECVAISGRGKDILFLRQVWCVMLPKARMPSIAMYEDNEGAIQIAKHPISNSNSKDTNERHHVLGKLVERKEMEIIYVSTEFQRADSSRRRYLRGSLNFTGG